MNTYKQNRNLDQHTFVNDNPDTANYSDDRTSADLDKAVDKDLIKESEVDMLFAKDQSADTDANKVANDTTFKNDNH